ncbi:MAG: hypothetical protein GY953_11290, partial [bacterium]|nr:hypothetical protein [bacterium]
LTLPRTPPKREGVDPFAFRKALRLFRYRSFTVLVVTGLIVAAVHNKAQHVRARVVADRIEILSGPQHVLDIQFGGEHGFLTYRRWDDPLSFGACNTRAAGAHGLTAGADSLSVGNIVRQI